MSDIPSTLGELPRIPIPRTSVNKGKRKDRGRSKPRPSYRSSYLPEQSHGEARASGDHIPARSDLRVESPALGLLLPARRAQACLQAVVLDLLAHLDPSLSAQPVVEAVVHLRVPFASLCRARPGAEATIGTKHPATHHSDAVFITDFGGRTLWLGGWARRTSQNSVYETV
jgi:hypothetical protein